MMQHPESTTLALLIAAERETDLEYAAYTVLARYLNDWSEDRKADLYARLAESLEAGDTIAQMTVKCSRALWDNQNEQTR